MYFIQSNFGNKGDFEVVILESNHIVHYRRSNDDSVLPWYRSAEFGDNVSSEPSLIQSNVGNKRNFEVVVREGNKLRHYWRDNDIQDFPWNKGALFGDKINSAPALIQSNVGNKRNFEVVVREGSKLRHYWRDNDVQDFPWNKGALFGDKVNSAPALIQSNVGNKGNFEVVVREGNKLRHYWRDNDIQDFPWNKGALFGDKINSAPALIQSNVGNKGNFEVVVREGNKLRHYWRDNDVQDFPWKKGTLFGDHITYYPSLVQSNDKSNFEVFTRRGNCLVHFWRNNDAPDFPWSEEILTHAIVPLGEPPNHTQKSTFIDFLLFSNLRNWRITAGKSPNYNCISWSVGVTDQWFWPDDDTVAGFDKFYSSYGWKPSVNGNREYKKRKVALWADVSGCTHGSCETYDCDWHESKCGMFERIMHDKFQMEGGKYGKIIKYYEKYDPNANLDLASLK